MEAVKIKAELLSLQEDVRLLEDAMLKDIRALKAQYDLKMGGKRGAMDDYKGVAIRAARRYMISAAIAAGIEETKEIHGAVSEKALKLIEDGARNRDYGSAADVTEKGVKFFHITNDAPHTSWVSWDKLAPFLGEKKDD